jgi:glycosyltransferase involved in cell wall biosynthesis
VPFEAVSDTDFEPRHPERFAKDLASAINTLLCSPEERTRMGLKARERVEEYFSWKSIASQTMKFYRDIMRKPCTP